MIQLDSITVQLGTQTIVNRFSLEIAKGDKVAVYGESGSGKSTLLKTLIGMHLPVNGRIVMQGLDFVPANLPTIRKEVFYLPQDILAQGEETAMDYLKAPFALAVNRGAMFPEMRLGELMATLRLKAETLTQPLGRLSGGERKRVGLLRGMLLNRAIILADEPSAGVDASNRDVIVNMLFRQSDATVVAVTHDEEFLSMADKKVQMHSHGMPDDTTDAHGRP
ncbi:MAG: ATP-binding cassette domain-containing protein [Deltaproteobacteria bacterium]|nr:ATP-binding cassette domain-containing protein [Deltaproteobacteria bacterium]